MKGKKAFSLGVLFLSTMLYGKNDLGNGFFLEDNGITITCDTAAVGSSSTIENNGKIYTKISSQSDIDKPNFSTPRKVEPKNACTSGITSMSKWFNYDREFNQDISHWDTSSVTDMHGMFDGAHTFNQNIELWDMSKVTDVSNMFSNAYNFNQPIENWDTSSFKFMGSMFYKASTFNQQIGRWDTSNVISMYRTFFDAKVFNQPIGNWNTSNVTSMREMFKFAFAFNQPIGNWNTSKVTDMSHMFANAHAFNQPIGNWNTSNVLNMSSMFEKAYKFNYSIEEWNTSKVKYMSSMFFGTPLFNQPLNKWDTSSVEYMDRMFAYSDKFNQPIGSWNTSNVKGMSYMFRGAESFNQDLKNWNTNNVTTMDYMFERALTFSQCLKPWNVSNITSKPNFFDSNAKFDEIDDLHPNWGSTGGVCPKPPTSANAFINIDEDTSKTFEQSDFIYSSSDNRSFKSIHITKLPKKGKLTYNLIDVTLNQEIEYTEINKLKFIPTKHENGVEYTNFGFKVDNGLLTSDEYLVTFNVAPINDSPIITSKPIINIDENKTYSYELQAEDLEKDNLIWKLKNNTTLPSWLNFKAPSNEWEKFGNSMNTNKTDSLIFDSKNTPYILYSNDDTKELELKKFDGMNWIKVSDTKIAKSTNIKAKLKIDSNDNIYIFYFNKTLNIFELRKFDGTTWSQTYELKIDLITNHNFSFDLDNNGTPFIAYFEGVDNKGYIKKFVNEQWVDVSIFTEEISDFINMKIDSDNNIYIAYLNSTNSVTVKKHNGTNFIEIDSIKSSNQISNAVSLNLAINSQNHVYLTFVTINSSFVNYSKQREVYKLNTNTWEKLPDFEIWPNDDKVSITFDKEGAINIAFMEYDGNKNIIHYKKYKNGSWEEIATPINGLPISDFVLTYDKKYEPFIFYTKGEINESLSEVYGINNKWLISGIPTNENIGEHPINLVLSDGKSEIDHNFTIVVQDVNDTPTFTNTNFIYDKKDKELEENILFSNWTNIGNNSYESKEIISDNMGIHEISLNTQDDFYVNFDWEIVLNNYTSNFIFGKSFSKTPELEKSQEEKGKFSKLYPAGKYEFVFLHTKEDSVKSGNVKISNLKFLTKVNDENTVLVSISENVKSVIDIDAEDIDINDTVTYSISGKDSSLFDINSTTGELSFKKAPDFETALDENSDNTYEIIVTLSDQKNAQSSKNFKISVTNVKEPTFVQIANTTVNEDSATNNIDLQFIDIDNIQNAIYDFTLSNDTLANVKIENGKLVVTPKENKHGTFDINLKVTVNNQEYTQTFTYTINSINDKPIIHDIDNIILEQSPSVISNSFEFDIWDDSIINSLKVQSSNTNLIKQTDIKVEKLSEEKARLTYKIEENKNGISDISITIDDNEVITKKDFKIIVKIKDDALCVDNTVRSLDFEEIKGLNLAQNYIINNLNLISSIDSICNSNITWKSSDNTVINDEGIINISDDEKTIVLTATVSKGNYSKKKSFLLTVPADEVTDLTAVNNITFEMIKANNARQDKILSDLDLISTSLGKTVIWSSSNNSLIDISTGIVSRGLNNEYITLTATIGNNTKDFYLTIIAMPNDNTLKINKDKEWLNFERILDKNRDNDNVIYNLVKPLPTTAPNGSNITWQSSNEDVITTNADVTRNTLRDIYVTLTATFENNGTSDSKTFLLKVLKNEINNTNDNINFKRMEDDNTKISVVVDSNGEDKNTEANFDPSILNKIQKIISDDSLKSVLELADRTVNMFLNTDGTTQSQAEFINDGQSVISSIKINSVGSSTNMSDNGTIVSNVTLDANTNIKAELNVDGSVSHIVEKNNIQSIATSNIPGARVEADNDGNVETSSELRENGSIYKAVVTTNKEGLTKTKFAKVDLTTGEESEINNTLKDDGSYEHGNSITIDRFSGKIYMKIVAPINNNLVIE